MIVCDFCDRTNTECKWLVSNKREEARTIVHVCDECVRAMAAKVDELEAGDLIAEYP